MKNTLITILLILPQGKVNGDQTISFVSNIGMEEEPFGGSRKFHSKRSLGPIVVDRELDKLKCIGFDQYLSINQLCDSISDCPDSSDEFSCGKSI